MQTDTQEQIRTTSAFLLFVNYIRVKELAQYCIDMIGSCYLYYKDYELIEAENVNALNKRIDKW